MTLVLLLGLATCRGVSSSIFAAKSGKSSFIFLYLLDMRKLNSLYSVWYSSTFSLQCHCLVRPYFYHTYFFFKFICIYVDITLPLGRHKTKTTNWKQKKRYAHPTCRTCLEERIQYHASSYCITPHRCCGAL